MTDKRPLEMCVVCDEKTGSSGHSDDSIYADLNFPCVTLSLKVDDEIGPLCSDCYYSLWFVGFITHDTQEARR